jgi:beta-galactosidase
MAISRRDFLSGTAVTLGALSLQSPMWALAAPNAPSNPVPLLLGVDYYPDQTPDSLWEEDARMMADFGITNVRVAEFAWALMEPSEGKFDFDWLQRSIEILRNHNIVVILGTPSAAPPPWLTAKYPELVMVNAQGLPLHPGGRRFTCPSNKTYRRLSIAIATEMARTFAETAGVIGWQIDNEFTLSDTPRCYCNFCRAGFQEWLREKYGNLEKLNQDWGTVFWSQKYTDFAQVPVPLLSGGDPNPGLALDYDRYQSYANVSFMEEQLVMLRQKCPRHFITTNNVGLVDYINERDLYAKLDFVAFDNYPGFFKMLMEGQPNPDGSSWEAILTMVAMGHDFGRSLKGGKPFMIMEEQSGKAGQRTFSPQPEKGQLRLWTHQAVAHGAMGMNYFRWDTATFGAEEYWHGILNHDRSTSPGFEEIRQTIKELKTLGRDVLESQYLAEAAVIFDYDCSWAVPIQPGHPKLSYLPQVVAWYGTLSSSHTGIDVIVPGANLSPYKIVVAPLPYVMSEAQAQKIREFVRNGGTFVAGYRLGAKNEFSQIVRTPLPGLLRDVMGVTVEDYVPLYSEKPGVKLSGFSGAADGKCGLWADVLQPSGAEVLATYTNFQYAGKPAITSNSFGKGKAVYIGADLDPMGLARVLRTLAIAAGIQAPQEVPIGVEMTIRQARGKRWMFLMNHKPDAQTVKLATAGTDLLTGQARSGEVELSGYGVQVLQMSEQALTKSEGKDIEC